MGTTASKPRNAVIGVHITDVPNEFGGFTRKATPIQGGRAHGFNLGDLTAARAGFETATGLTMEWLTEGEDV